MKKNILKQTQTIAYSGKEPDLTNAQQLLMDHLTSNQYDTAAWLLLARLECNPPFYDQDRIIHYAQHILLHDPSNAYAFLLWSYADHYLMGNADDDFYDQLCMAHDNNKEIMSMIELAKARSIELRNIKKYEEALKRSIEYCSTHVINFHLLGKLYIKQGKILEGQQLIEQGLGNIKKLLKCQSVDDWVVDYVTIEGLLNEFFSGVVINDLVVGSW